MNSRVLLILFFLFLSSLAFGKSQQLKLALSAAEISKLNYQELQKVRSSYLNFLIEANQKYELQPETSYIKYLKHIQFISSAYSDSTDLCFFGGWPSRMSGDYCRSPWREKDDALVQNYGGYSSSFACGNPNEFRCNPVLFGAPGPEIVSAGSPINGVEVNLSPESNGVQAGYCVVNNGDYKELTQKCERASRGSLNSIIDSYKENPAQLEQFAGAIAQFCQNHPEYDACDDLAKRLQEIALGAENGVGSTNPKLTDGRALSSSKQIPAYAKSILNKCNELLKEDDIKNRNLFSDLTLAQSECVPPEINSLNRFDELDQLKQQMEKDEVLSQINETSFSQSLKALVANEIKFGGKSAFDTAMPDAFVRSILDKYPSLKSNEEFTEAAKLIYGEIDFAIKNDDLVPLEENSVTEQFNELASQLNQACRQVYDEFKGRRKENVFQRAGRWLKGHLSIATNPYGYAQYKADKAIQKSLQDQYKPTLEGLISSFASQSEVGHLLGTEYFQDNVMDLSDNFAKECATDPNYKMIREPLKTEEIRKGHEELNQKMQDNIKKVADVQRTLDYGFGRSTNKELRSYIKDDPSIAIMTLLNTPPENQAAFGAHMCAQAKDIFRSDKNWRIAEYLAGGVGLVAGGILVATGFGAPIGAGLVGASMSAMGVVGAVTGLGALEKWEDADLREKANDLAMMEQRVRTSRYIEEFNKTQDQKWESYKQGGLAVLEMIPAIRVTRIYPMARALPGANQTVKALPQGTKLITQGSRGGQKLLTSGGKSAQRALSSSTRQAPRLQLLSGTKGLDKFLKNSQIQKLLEQLKTIQKRINYLRARGQYGLGEVEYARMHKNKYALIRKMEAVFKKMGGRPSEVKQYVKRIMSRQT